MAATTSSDADIQTEVQVQVQVQATTAELTAFVADQLINRVAELIATNGQCAIVLTGGRTGVGVLVDIAAHPRRYTVDWPRVSFFWSDDRYLPASARDRSMLRAPKALLANLPVDPRRVFAIPASDTQYLVDADAAAAQYDSILCARDRVGQPLFDICLLRIGEAGHVGSLFPHTAEVAETTRFAVAVHNCPKPPPVRITLTLAAINRSSEVWIIATGDAKSNAIAGALGGADPLRLPAAGVHGIERTRWFLDDSAANGTVAPHRSAYS